MRFQMFRAKYLALPAATWVHEGPIDEAPARLGDYVLVLRKWQREPGYQPLAASGYTDSLAANTGLELESVFDESEGFLLEIDRPYVDDD